MAQTWSLSGKDTDTVGGALLTQGNDPVIEAYIELSAPSTTATDTGERRNGTYPINFNEDGTWSQAGLPATDDPEYVPEIQALRIVSKFLDPGTRRTRKVTSNWFKLTEDSTFSQLVEAEQTQVETAYEAANRAEEARDTSIIASESASASALSAAESAELAQLIANIVNADDTMTAVDFDAASSFRVQQDARLTTRIRELQRGRYVPPSGDTTGATDQAAMQVAIDTYGGAFLGRGDYYVDFPVELRSRTFAVGLGKGITRVTSTSTVMAGVIFLTGNLHPGFWPVDLGGTSNPHPRYSALDYISVPADMATVVTRNTTSLSIAVGDLVIVKTAEFHPHIRRVTAVSGNNVTLHKPLDGIAGATLAAITKGESASHPATPSTGPQRTLQSYICEKTLIQGMSFSTTNAWSSRTGCLEGTFRDIDCIDTHALAFGNGATECLFENISGNFRARAIEFTDGARDNRFNNIRGVCTGGADYSAGEPLMKLGHRAHLSNFHIFDILGRRGPWISTNLFANGTVRDGYIRGDLPADDLGGAGTGDDIISEPKFPLVTTNGWRISDLTLDIVGQIQISIIKLTTTSDNIIRNILVNNPGGKATGVYTVRAHSSVITNTILDNIIDSTGSDDTVVGLDGLKLLNLSWRTPHTGRVLTNVSVNYVANDQERTVTFTNAGAVTYTISGATAWGIGTIVRLMKTGTGSLNLAVSNGAVLVLDAGVTLPVSAPSRLVVEKISATEYYVRRG